VNHTVSELYGSRRWKVVVHELLAFDFWSLMTQV